ncbi:MAG: hypothetical protein QOE70_4626, partial [Chthoniobacter sp.]|nr:hypothetical protein [Chthoniobacter sp.]
FSKLVSKSASSHLILLALKDSKLLPEERALLKESETFLASQGESCSSRLLMAKTRFSSAPVVNHPKKLPTPKETSARTSCALFVATLAIAPFTVKAAVTLSPVTYAGGTLTDNVAPSGTDYPVGWFGLQVTNGAPTATANTTLTNVVASQPNGTFTVGLGLYDVTGLTPVGTYGTTGLGSVDGTTGGVNTTNAFVLELQNTSGSSAAGITLGYALEVWRQAQVNNANPVFNDSFQIQFHVGSRLNLGVPGEVQTLSSALGTAGAGWTSVVQTEAFSATTTVNTVRTNAGTAYSFASGTDTSWGNGEYLYIRFYDTNTQNLAVGDNLGMAINGLSVSGILVPEPSTCGLLLACVGFGAIRRRRKVAADALAAA